jgi:hypothetical protein
MLITNLLQFITKTLDSQNIPYMLSGSLALTLYAIPGATRGIDMIVELQDNQIITFIDTITINSIFINQP